MKSKIKILVLAGLFVLALGGGCVGYYQSQDNVNFTVARSERVTDGDSSYYLVFTPDETFSNSDSLMFMKFNSSDLHGQLLTDKSFNADVVGWRVPFLSMYRNILEIRELTVDENETSYGD